MSVQSYQCSITHDERNTSSKGFPIISDVPTLINGNLIIPRTRPGDKHIERIEATKIEEELTKAKRFAEKMWLLQILIRGCLAESSGVDESKGR